MIICWRGTLTFLKLSFFEEGFEILFGLEDIIDNMMHFHQQQGESTCFDIADSFTQAISGLPLSPFLIKSVESQRSPIREQKKRGYETFTAFDCSLQGSTWEKKLCKSKDS